jgi:hypothetical protein
MVGSFQSSLRRKIAATKLSDYGVGSPSGKKGSETYNWVRLVIRRFNEPAVLIFWEWSYHHSHLLRADYTIYNPER